MGNEPNEEPSRGRGDLLDSDNWQSRYEAGETGWDRGETSPALMQWLERADLQPCRILVPGCGRGYEVVELASRGFEVTALDFAIAPVQELTRKLTAAKLVANVRQEDVLEYASNEKFDAIYEQTCLCAIDPKLRSAYEQRLAEHVREGGMLFALFMQAGDINDGPPFKCELEAMRDLFATSRWVWSETQFLVEHPAGPTEIATMLQRRESV